MTQKPDPLHVEHEVLARVLADQRAGQIGSAEHYRRLFPAAGELVERTLRQLRDDADEPETYGSFEVISVLARGGQGVVYLARDTELPRTVALKVLHASGVDDESLRLRFRREAEVAARLDHPTLCKVLAFGFERGVPYLVMPFIEGRPLSEVIAASDSGPAELLSPASGVSSTRTAPAFVAAAARLVERLARGLHVAHELGVVHRDVKPGNILLTPDGDPVLLDFGLARDDEAVQHQLTHSHDVLGTPAYMSPEQVRGERSDRRADVFALAVVLYELLAGERPFRGASRRELFDAITRGAWQPLQRVRAGTPRDLDLVLSVALETEPDRRYETALAFADDLSRVIARQPVLARPVGPIGRLARWCQRNRLLAASVATVITTLAITGGISTAAWQRSEEARAEAEAIHDYILGDLLAAARPRGLGRAARIVDTLEHAAAEVDARFADRPALGATVRLRLATTFRSLGLWQQALDLAEKSHEVRRAIFGDGSAEALRARLEIATAQLQLTRWEAVLRTLAEEGAFEATFGSESPEALRAGVVLAAARARINGAEDLLPRIRALHAAAVRTCGGGSETAMLTATALFDTLTGLNRYEDCVAFARTHSELMRHSHGVDSAEAAEAALDLGTALIRANFPRQALEATSALLDRLRASHGPEHPLVAVAHGTIANSLAQLDRSDESIEHYLEAYRIFAAGLGPEHPHTLVAQNDLAIGYRIAGRLDLAHQHAMAALESRRRVLGEQSPGVASSLSALSAIAMSREDFAGAADFAQRAIDMVEASPGMGGPDLAGLYWNLARCLASTEQFVRAAEVWTRILEMDRKTGGPDSPWVAADQRRYGRILYLCGRLDEAADACDDATRIYRLAEHPDAKQLACVRSTRRLVAYRRGEPGDHLARLEATWRELEELDSIGWLMQSDYLSALEELYRLREDEAGLASVRARRRKWPGIR